MLPGSMTRDLLSTVNSLTKGLGIGEEVLKRRGEASAALGACVLPWGRCQCSLAALRVTGQVVFEAGKRRPFCRNLS